jgi:transposase
VTTLEGSMKKIPIAPQEKLKLNEGEFFCFQKNLKNGSIYVYAGKSTRVSGKKDPESKKRYLGKLNQETGEIIETNCKKYKQKNQIPLQELYNTDQNQDIDQKSCPKKLISSISKIYGPYLILDKLCKDIGLFSLLKIIFPDTYNEILSIVYYIVHKGNPLYRMEGWTKRLKHPHDSFISSQRISELLREITEDNRQNFLNQWIKIVQEKEYLCYDITSISSYSKSNPLIRKGYNRDKENLEQLNLALLYGQETMMPAYYRKLPGNLNDVKSLKKSTEFFKILGLKKLNIVLDKGFYSQNNLTDLLDFKQNFILSVPTSRKWVEAIIDEFHETIHNPDYYHKLKNGESIYSVLKNYKWGPKNYRLYVHLFYSDKKVCDDHQSFMNKLLTYKEEVESENRIKSHEKYYLRYLIVKYNNNKTFNVTFNTAEVIKHRQRYSGYFCLVSRNNKDSLDILHKYRNKDVVEKSFDNLKNHLDMKRLRVHIDEAMYSRIFLQFLALILANRLRYISYNFPIIKDMSVKEILEEVESLILTSFNEKHIKIYSEIAKRENLILDAFNVVWPL